MRSTRACAARCKRRVRNSRPFLFLIYALGIALLLAGLFFEEGTSASAAQVASPTPDRLAQPTLPAAPTQADRGAQVYWLSCLPCHGDRGQGLTDEFRETYPPEDRNCWKSGCHGPNPYDSGFTLPTTIPALVSPQALAKFNDAAQLEGFVQAAMPFWKPGSLTEEQSWQVTAFLLRQNGLWDGAGELSAQQASQVRIGRAAPTSAPDANEHPSAVPLSVLAGVAGVLLVTFAAVVLLARRTNS